MPDLTHPAHAVPNAPTPARLSLGRSEPAQSTADHLAFQLDHALARDAVHAPLDVQALAAGLTARGLTPVILRSAVPQETRDRRAYLRRPDLGRTLDPASASALAELAPALPMPPALLILLADGLSALAVERHALPLLDALLPLLNPGPLALTPVCINARVALGDAIGEALDARLTVLLIGERPGLSSPDSLGCYITYAPRPGRTDAERNCISNIRAEGLSYAEAAHRIAYYVRESLRLHTTGIALKDPAPMLPSRAEAPSFLPPDSGA